MKRLLILAVGLGAVLAVPVAQADQPVITPAPGSDFVDTTSCGFPVSVHFTVNGETAKTFSSGKTIITGPFVAQFSANGKSVTLNVAGPVTITPTDGSVLFIGRGVGAGPVSTPTGVTLGYLAGTVSIDPTTGVATLVHGHMLLDICEALAP
jgi:hypothetical protein